MFILTAYRESNLDTDYGHKMPTNSDFEQFLCDDMKEVLQHVDKFAAQSAKNTFENRASYEDWVLTIYPVVAKMKDYDSQEDSDCYSLDEYNDYRDTLQTRVDTSFKDMKFYHKQSLAYDKKKDEALKQEIAAKTKEAEDLETYEALKKKFG